MSGVLRTERSGIKIENITRVGSGFRPRGWTYRKKLFFDLALSIAQTSCVGLDISKGPAKIGRLLRSHASSTVKLYRLIRHRAHSRRDAGHRTVRRSRWKSFPRNWRVASRMG